MKSIRRNKCYLIFVQFALPIIITLALFEIIGLYSFYKKTGRLYYTHLESNTENFENAKEEKDTFKEKLVLDPYFGYIHSPLIPLSGIANSERLMRLLRGSTERPSWLNLSTNNYGFLADIDYPYKKKSDKEFFIGVFGGSVAQWFSLQGAERLAHGLYEKGFLRGREIRILNFSQGGFKQPQQLQALTYFLAAGQEFDLILNIDGFNEIALSTINAEGGYDPLMPSLQHIFPILKILGNADKNYKVIDELYAIRELQKETEYFTNKMRFAKFASLNLIYSFFENKTRSQYAFALAEFGGHESEKVKMTHFVHLQKLGKKMEAKGEMESVFSAWRNSSEVMQHICDAENILYLEVIQPNQYFSKKHFTSEERQFAISEKSPYRDAIESGYPLLGSQIESMQKKGVNVVSAVHIFDSVQDVVYSDNCCHYNQTGNEIFADFLLSEIALLFK